MSIASDLDRCFECRVLPERTIIELDHSPFETIQCPVCKRTFQQREGVIPSAGDRWNQFHRYKFRPSKKGDHPSQTRSDRSD